MNTFTHAENNSFNVDLAKKYGVECAIVLGHLAFWIGVNRRNKVNHRDGKTWTYQTRKGIAAAMPYFTEEQVRRFTDKLCDLGVLVKGNYNRSAMDKTIWYAFADEEIVTTGESAKSTGEFANGVGESATPVPDTNKDTKTNNNPEVEVDEKKDKGKIPPWLAKALPFQKAEFLTMRAIANGFDLRPLKEPFEQGLADGRINAPYNWLLSFIDGRNELKDAASEKAQLSEAAVLILSYWRQVVQSSHAYHHKLKEAFSSICEDSTRKKVRILIGNELITYDLTKPEDVKTASKALEGIDSVIAKLKEAFRMEQRRELQKLKREGKLA